jgi:hypothetical protein
MPIFVKTSIGGSPPNSAYFAQRSRYCLFMCLSLLKTMRSTRRPPAKPVNWLGKADVQREHIYVPDAMRIAAAIGHR